ncbi:2Fe-2S iron-sulfur cluster-binding protein [Streptomyces sp. NPDC052040]|uniref:2Fe-2S iron-sulfur cluster-binding protein n=1 Tax=unclassified Streptomyces TaxID=2593676 RepID=UPI0037D41198
MTDDQHPEGTPQGGTHGSWERLPQGDYDDGATAFVQLPEGGIDALLAAHSPLAAPGHGYVPPTFDPAAEEGTGPAAAGTWAAPAEGARWPEPDRAAPHGAGDRFTHHPGATGQWSFEEAAAAQEHPAPGHDVTGEWSIPVAGGDLPDESGEFSTSSLVEQWGGGAPPATLPGGAPAPWATGPAGHPWAEETHRTPGAPPASGHGEAAGEPSDGPYDEPYETAGEPSERAYETTEGAYGEPYETAEGPNGESYGTAGEPSEGSYEEPYETAGTDGAPEAPEAAQEAPEAADAPAAEEDRAADTAPEAAPDAVAAEDPAPAAADAGDQDPGPPPPPQDEHPLVSYVLRVNGSDRPVTDAWIGESLLYVLRERLGLAGAKDGCSQGECGACNVQVDGRLVASCLVPAVTAAGSEVRTVEGLAADGRPSDVQRALARCGAVQCGFCIPGMAMTVHDLLEGNPAPTEPEARQALCGNLCRCSGYRGVLEAVQEVAAERRAHSEAEQAPDPGEPRIPHQAGPGAGGVHPTAFDGASPHEHPYGQDGGQA